MTPTNQVTLFGPCECNLHDATKHDDLLESTLDAYEVDDLTESDLGRFLAEVVFQLTFRTLDLSK